MPELKPCPFCGAPGFVEIQRHNSIRPDDYHAGCDNQSVECPTNAIIVEGATKKECINKWNTRFKF